MTCTQCGGKFGTTDHTPRSCTKSGRAPKLEQSCCHTWMTTNNQNPRVTMGTYIVVVEGSELIVAWKRTDLDETAAIRTLPLLDILHTVPSLTILRAVAGDVIYMPRDTVHMVVTEAHKVHLAFHVYEE